MNKIKVPVIPPLLVNGVLETDFQRKANIFNDQCSIIDNSSILPEFSFLTNNRISDVVFSHEDISKFTVMFYKVIFYHHCIYFFFI